MHVVHITRNYPPLGNGGLSTAVSGMVRALSAVGVKSSVVSFDNWRPRKKRGADERPVRVDNVIRLSTPAQVRSTLTMASELMPSVIHVHHSMLWDFAAELKALAKCPSVVSVHVAQAIQNRLRGIDENTLSLQAQIVAFANADAVISPSQVVTRWLRREYPDTMDKVRTIGLGTAAGPAEKRHQAGPVTYVGRFADINGTSDLVRAFACIHQQRPDTSFVVAGGCPDSPRADARWRKQLRDAVPADKLELHGWLPWADLEGIYRGASVVVIPSWFETFGQVAAEAMAFGAAIAACDAGALGEHLLTETSALLSQPRDVPALVANVMRLLDSPTLANSLGEAAARSAQRQFQWPEKARDISDLYACLRVSHGATASAC